MFAVGHLAWGYTTGKFSSNITNVKINIPLILFCSIIPDIDLIIPGIEHRGPTHSIIVASLFFIPIFTTYGKRTIPYFIALAQHSLFGDYATGGAMILWPINSNRYSLGVCMKSPIEISLELTGFLISLAFMIKTKDIWTFFKPHRTNLILSAPATAILGSLFFKIGYSVPIELVLPHLAYLTIFILSILTDLRTILKAT